MGQSYPLSSLEQSIYTPSCLGLEQYLYLSCLSVYIQCNKNSAKWKLSDEKSWQFKDEHIVSMLPNIKC